MKSDKRFVIGILAILAGMGMTSCSDDSAGKNNGDPCASLTCTDGLVCKAGECVDPCKDKTCGDGLVCKAGECVDPCKDKTCGDGLVCKAGECVDPCKDKTCGENQVCEAGECVEVDPCVGVKCGSGEACYEGDCYDLSCIVDDKPMTCDNDLVCSDGKCVEKACVGVDCVNGTSCLEGKCIDNECIVDGKAMECENDLVCSVGTCIEEACVGITCPDGQACLAGDCLDEGCIENGAEKACGENQMCVKGECIDDGCLIEGEPMACDEGWQCVKGNCAETACLGVDCPEGQSCTGGECIDNECLAMTCDAGTTCVKGDCILDNCVGKDPCLQGKVCVEDGSCQFTEAPAIVAQLPTETTTDETGKSEAIGVSLNNEPAADVKLVCDIKTDSPNIEATVECDKIVFNADNWSDIQTIVVTGAADDTVDGDQKYAVVIKTSSEDPEFDGLVLADVEMTNLDVNQANLNISVIDTESLMTSEDGTSGKLSVSLNSKPTSEVHVTVSSSNPNEGKVDKSELIFTPDNWNVEQIVTVTGVDDKVEDGTQQYRIDFAASSEDPNYKGMTSNVEAFNVDNDKAGVSVLTSSIETDESGKTAQIPVRLNSQPTSDVTVTIAVSDSTEAKANVASITFTSANYNDIQNIVITGLEDNIVDGNQNYTVTLTFSSSDSAYGKTAPVVVNGINYDKDVADIYVNPNGATSVTEAGSSVKMDVLLSAIPTSEVTVALSVSDSTELKVTPTSIKFDASNWNKAQVVTVTGVDDSIIDGDIVSNVDVKSTSSDKDFDGKSKSITFTTLDDDKAGIAVTSTKASLSEKGGTASFSVALTAEPAKNVNISFVSTDITELDVDTPKSLTFTPSNWNVAQTVKIKAIDDTLADGNQQAHINLKSTSDDANFNGLTAQTVDYEILDDETVSVVLALESTTLKPGAYSTTISVSLSTEPVNDVEVSLATTNAVTAALGKTSFTFTPSNWKTAQTTTVTNTDPLKASKAVSTEKFNATAKSVGAYNNAKSNEVSVKIIAFESSSMAYTGKEESLTLLPGTYQLEVWGAQGTAQYDGGSAGKGGYASGKYTVTKPTVFYVNVGGVVYNGGGSAQTSGGGATHIATASGLLSKLSSNQSSVLLVAGGGGGGERTPGGYGGGENGGVGSAGGNCTPATVAPGAGTQTAGGSGGSVNNGYGTAPAGSFGQGGSGIGNLSSADPGAGGGGGWYGGGGIPYCGGGGGGSSHIGTGVTGSTIAGNAIFPAPAGGNETGHAGTGYARITLVD